MDIRTNARDDDAHVCRLESDLFGLWSVCAEAGAGGKRDSLEISNLRNDKGHMLCALCSSAQADAFPKKADKAVAADRKDEERQAVCDFTEVAPGTYTVSVVHDENANGKLDMNFSGMPREGVGASNDAKGHMGRPKFCAASFRYVGERLELKIRVNYL
jgi:uncharacterized protein (DUF2141 family)